MGTGAVAPAGATPLVIGGAAIATTGAQLLDGAQQALQPDLDLRMLLPRVLVQQVEHGEQQVWLGAWQQVVGTDGVEQHWVGQQFW